MLNVSDVIRGCTDTVILAMVNEGDSYGYQINKEIFSRSGGQLELKEATLYTSFRRLEGAGLILSYWGDEATGARRRYYAITPTGKQTLAENMDDWQKTKVMLDKLITNNEGSDHQYESKD